MQSNQNQKVTQYLREHALNPKKHLGQNFLIEESVYTDILDNAQLTKEDTVIEVGPGLGTLTELLVTHAGQVIAVEKDDDLIPILEKDFEHNEHFSLLHGSILDCTILEEKDHTAIRLGEKILSLKNTEYKLIANIPYYITSPILFKFLKAATVPSQIILLIQKEVAEKVVLQGKGSTMLSITAQTLGTPRIIRLVAPEAFHPAPKVTSALLEIIPHKEPIIKSNLSDFERIVKMGFSNKRKKLTHGLHAGLHISKEEARELLQATNIDQDIRPEQVTIEEWDRLTQKITEQK